MSASSTNENGAGPTCGIGPVNFFKSIREDRLEENLQAQLHRAGAARTKHGIGT
jgi:hypothetical protein